MSPMVAFAPGLAGRRRRPERATYSVSPAAPALAATAGIKARQALRQQGLRYVLGAGGCRIGDDPAAVLVEIDVRHGELALGQNGRKRVARGLGQIALLAAARLHLRRIDPAQ